MPEKTIKTFGVKFLQILDESGKADTTLLPELSTEEFLTAYHAMILSRTFNRMALALQREGRLGTYASILGQEASETGSALALEADDWIFPSFRETGVYISRGYPLWLMLRYWHGDERGMEAPEGQNIFPMSVPVGTQITHAVGAAMAMRIRGDKNVAVTYFGDGGSSRGDFHEGLNLAGVFKAPVIFLCQNNQWAISVPRERQTLAETIAQRAAGYGIPGIQVDGNDVLAVYSATAKAVIRARAGEGPTLIECFTYRLDDHTTADDSSRYRTDEEVEEWQKKEPLIRYRKFLYNRGILNEKLEKKIATESEEAVKAAVKEAEAFAPPHPAEMIKYTSATLSERQTKEIKALGWEGKK
ncbi:MAG: pyruvate dehydrogenase (acetyl-transferring) E1 component subunit alpha [Thermodesulfobacteriota bacterium]